MSADYFEEQQKNKVQRKRALERRKQDYYGSAQETSQLAPSFKDKRRRRHEIRNVLKNWEFLEDDSELLYDD